MGSALPARAGLRAAAGTAPIVDPAAGDAAILFGGAHHNSDSYMLDGWSPPDGDTSWAWNSGRFALLRLHAQTRPGRARRWKSIFISPPHTSRAANSDSQRVALTFNGQDLGTWRIDAHTPSPQKISIPAAVWSEQSTAVFRLEFPDAISPMEIGESTDERTLAVGGEKIVFHLVPAPSD